jgi:RNA polymerase sigma factor (sigma-70 family)
VRRYQDHAFRLAYVITGSAADAEDAAQEGFVRAYRALGRFRSGAPFRPWLLTIVANVARTRRTNAMRHPPLELSTAAEHVPDDAAKSPEALALANERQRELLAAVNGLRRDDRDVIACRYFLDLSEAETAAALGCARGTVKSRLSRALGRLRERLSVSPTGTASDARPPRERWNDG